MSISYQEWEQLAQQTQTARNGLINAAHECYA